MRVTVFDRVPFSAEVKPEQALAYTRRVLLPIGFEERQLDDHPEVRWFERDGRKINLPSNADAPNYHHRVAMLCDDLMRLGVASQPSVILQAMALVELGVAEPVRVAPPEGWRCPVEPIDQRTGATLATCNAPAAFAQRLFSGRFVVTCAGCDPGHRTYLR